MRLLLAEDEQALSKALKAILERAGYTVDAVNDGKAALDCLDTGSYDGAVLDIMMPVLDGLEVLRQLRARGDLLPVLLLTAKAETDDKVQGLDSGANDYLTKPFAVRELLARVRAMTRARTAQTGSRLRLGNITRSTGRPMRCPRPRAASGCRAGNFRCWKCCCAARGTSSRKPASWSASGGRTAARSAAWYGYTSYLQNKLKALHADIRIRAVRGEGYVLEAVE